MKSKCLLDVIQGESEGFTIKVCEAVYYDKVLLTTNNSIRNAPFYDERFIKVIDSPEEINDSLFEFSGRVSFTKEARDYFSADAFLERIMKSLA